MRNRFTGAIIGGILMTAAVASGIASDYFSPFWEDNVVGIASGEYAYSFNGDRTNQRAGAMGARVDYAPVPNYGAPVHDAIPRISVRFDDGRQEQFRAIMNHFLPRKIPVALALNYYTLSQVDPSDNSRMSVKQVRQIIDAYQAAGVPISIIQHGNNNWLSGNISSWNAPGGDPTDLYETTLDDIDYEIDPQPIIDAFGIRPRVIVLPGDNSGSSYEWAVRNKSVFEGKLKEWGYWWSVASPGGDTQTPVHQIIPLSGMSATGADATSNENGVKVGGKPGHQNPYWMSVGTTVDLGTNFVESGTSAQWARVPNRPDNPRPSIWQVPQMNGWNITAAKLDLFKNVETTPDTLGDYNNLSAYGGNKLGWSWYNEPAVPRLMLEYTTNRLMFGSFRYRLYNLLLGHNQGGYIGLHSDEASWAQSSGGLASIVSANPTIEADLTALGVNYDFDDSIKAVYDGTGAGAMILIRPDEWVGHMNYEVMAWILKSLHDKGHLVLCTPEEMHMWMTGEFQRGVDLISNPRGLIPQYDIGDTIGPIAEYPMPRGYGSYAVESLNADNMAPFFGGHSGTPGGGIDGTDLADGAVGAREASQTYKDHMSGFGSVGPAGSNPGGFHIYGGAASQADDDRPRGVFINHGGIGPGRYYLDWAGWNDASDAIRLRSAGAAIMARRQDYAISYFNDTSSSESYMEAWEDTLMTVKWLDPPQDVFRAYDTFYNETRQSYGARFYFDIPEYVDTERSFTGYTQSVSGYLYYWLGPSTGASDSINIDYVRLIKLD